MKNDDLLIPVKGSEYRDLFEQKIAGRMFTRLTAIGVGAVILVAGGIYTVLGNLITPRLDSFLERIDAAEKELDGAIAGTPEIVRNQLSVALSGLPEQVRGNVATAVADAVETGQIARAAELFLTAFRDRTDLQQTFAQALADAAVDVLEDDPDRTADLLAAVLRDQAFDPETLRLYATVERDDSLKASTLRGIIFAARPAERASDWGMLGTALQRYPEADPNSPQVTSWILNQLVAPSVLPGTPGSTAWSVARDAIQAYLGSRTGPSEIALMSGFLRGYADVRYPAEQTTPTANWNALIVAASLAETIGSGGVATLLDIVEQNYPTHLSCVVLNALPSISARRDDIGSIDRLAFIQRLWAYRATQIAKTTNCLEYDARFRGQGSVPATALIDRTLRLLLRPTLEDWQGAVLGQLGAQNLAAEDRELILDLWTQRLEDDLSIAGPLSLDAEAALSATAEYLWLPNETTLVFDFSQAFGRILPFLSREYIDTIFAGYPEFFATFVTPRVFEPSSTFIDTLLRLDRSTEYTRTRALLLHADRQLRDHVLSALAAIPSRDHPTATALADAVAGFVFDDLPRAVLLAETLVRHGQDFGANPIDVAAVAQTNIIPDLALQGKALLADGIAGIYRPWPTGLEAGAVPAAPMTNGVFNRDAVLTPEPMWLDFILDPAATYRWRIESQDQIDNGFTVVLLDGNRERSVVASPYLTQFSTPLASERVALRLQSAAADQRSINICVEEVRILSLAGTFPQNPIQGSPSNANNCTSHNNYALGTVASGWVAIPVMSGTTYMFSTEVFGGADSTLTLYYQDNLERIDYNDDFDGWASRIVFTADRNAVVLVQVEHLGLPRGDIVFSAEVWERLEPR